MGDCTACENCAQTCNKSCKWFCHNILCCAVPLKLLNCCRENVYIPACLLIQKACQPFATCSTASLFLLESCLVCDCCSEKTKGTFGLGSEPDHTTSSYNVARSYYDKDAYERDKAWEAEKDKKSRDNAKKKARGGG